MEPTRSAFLALALTALMSPVANAALPSNPQSDPRFVILPNGKDLRTLSSSGRSLSLIRGDGKEFTASLQAKYLALKNETLTKSNHPVTWVLMDLDSRQVIAQSKDANRKQFGASVNKIFIGAALLDKQRGSLSSSQLKLMGQMIADSNNDARDSIHLAVGGGSNTRARQEIHKFTQRMGYARTRAFRGYMGSLHGNELTALETANFLFDTYQGRYPGAEYLWKILYTCRTGAGRARTYLPSDMYVGGKTGSYAGSTVDPETGRSTKVDVVHHTIVFNRGGRQYGLAIFANTGKTESTALLAGGLFREYINRR